MSVNVSVCLPLGIGIALIVELLASAKPKLDLDVRARKIHGERNERISLLLDQALQTHDLALVHEQLFIAHGIAVEDVSVIVRAE